MRASIILSEVVDDLVLAEGDCHMVVGVPVLVECGRIKCDNLPVEEAEVVPEEVGGVADEVEVSETLNLRGCHSCELYVCNS